VPSPEDRYGNEAKIHWSAVDHGYKAVHRDERSVKPRLATPNRFVMALKAAISLGNV
jgi:hypothetical protein